MLTEATQQARTALLVSVAVVALLALCGGCSPETAIRLTVSGDLRAGEDADAIAVGLWREGGQLWSSREPLGAGAVAWLVTIPSAFIRPGATARDWWIL